MSRKRCVETVLGEIRTDIKVLRTECIREIVRKKDEEGYADFKIV